MITKMYLNQAEIYSIIRNYYSTNDNYITVYSKMSICGEDVKIYFYVQENTNNSKIVLELTTEDLFNVLNKYLNNRELELVNFKNIGHVKKIEGYVNKDIPVFDGVELQVRNRSLHKKLSKIININK